jgi:hypothetical protein
VSARRVVPERRICTCPVRGRVGFSAAPHLSRVVTPWDTRAWRARKAACLGTEVALAYVLDVANTFQPELNESASEFLSSGVELERGIS